MIQRWQHNSGSWVGFDIQSLEQMIVERRKLLLNRAVKFCAVIICEASCIPRQAVCRRFQVNGATNHASSPALRSDNLATRLVCVSHRLFGITKHSPYEELSFPELGAANLVTIVKETGVGLEDPVVELPCIACRAILRKIK